MAITVVDKVQNVGDGAGGNVVLTFNIALQEGDVVYVWGGRVNYSNIATAPSGYTLLSSFNSPGFHGMPTGLWRKRMGASPDTSITFAGVPAVTDCYCCFVLRGVNASPTEDATTTMANSTAGSPDSPSITTVTANAMVLTLYACRNADVSVSEPTNYSDIITRAHNTMTVSGAVRTIASAGAENPPAWTTQGGGHWVAFTVAVRPTPSFTQNLTASLFTNGQTFQTQKVSLGLSAALHVDSDGLAYGHFVSPGPRTLTASVFTDGDSFFTQAVTVGARTLSATLYADADTFYTQIVAPAPIALSAALFSDGDAFFAHTITTGAITLSAALFQHVDFTFYPASIAVGSVELAPALFENAQDFEAHSISQSGATQQIMIMRFRDDLTDSFGTHTVSAGVVNLATDLFEDEDTFYTHAATPTINIALFEDDDTFYTHVLFFGVEATTFENAPTFYTHGIGEDVAVALFEDEDTFYTHLLEQALLLSAALFENESAYGNSVVTGGAATIEFASFKNENTFYLYNMSNTRRLSAPRGTVYGDYKDVRNNDPRTLSPFAS